MLRHSGATRAAVHAAVRDDHVELAVIDDGHGPAGELRSGAGLAGMRERAAVLGGQISYGAAGERGFEVRAVLPVRVEP